MTEKHTNQGTTFIQTLTDNAGIFIFAYSKEERCFLSWSNNAKSILGVSDSVVYKDNNLFLRHVHEDDRFALLKDFEKALNGKKDYNATYRWIRPDNKQTSWLHCRAKLVKRKNGYYFEGIIIDLSNEMTGLTSGVALPNSITATLNTFTNFIFILDSNLKILRVNRAKDFLFGFGDEKFNAKMFKRGKFFLNCFSDVTQKTYYQNILNSILEGEIKNHKTRILQNKEVYRLEFYPSTSDKNNINILATVSNISDLISIEKKLANLEKTESLQLVAAGITHKFSNTLQAILGHTTMIENHSENQDLVKKATQAIVNTVTKASEYTKKLHQIKEKTTSNHPYTDLNLSIMTAGNNIKDLFSSKIKLSMSFGNVANILANQEKITDAIEIVLRNAKESIKNNKGKISIKTYEVYLKETEIQDLKEGPYAKLTIRDSGLGMDEDEQKNCLNPFYSTKEIDPGSGISISGRGLGLSKAFGIIRNFNGAIEVNSQPGKGTEISFYLPIQSSELSKRITEKISKVSVINPQILIVDDDSMILETIKAMIEDFGYNCITTLSGNVAVDLVKKHSKTLKLAIVDAIMPGLSGPVITRRIKRANPKLSILGFSGAIDDISKNMIKAGALKVLKKPVSSGVLKNTIEDLLNNNEEQGPDNKWAKPFFSL